jgi:hypothetical protein
MSAIAVFSSPAFDSRGLLSRADGTSGFLTVGLVRSGFSNRGAQPAALQRQPIERIVDVVGVAGARRQLLDVDPHLREALFAANELLS